MMKYLSLLICLLTWKLSNGNMAIRPRIDTIKYNVANKKIKELNVKSEKWFSVDEKKRWSKIEYDTLGRITAVFNHLVYGEQYLYSIKNDTLTKIEYESRNKELIKLNKIEKFIYNKSQKVKTYISTYKTKNRNFNRTKFNEISLAIIEVDQLYYDSLQRIVKIKHFSKSFADQMLQLDSILPIENLQLISTDTFIYSTRQTTATRVPVDSSLTESIFNQTLYDDKYRVTNDITICKFNNSPNDTLEKKYAYKRNKMTCLIKTYDIILTDLTRLNTDEIRTEYYNDSGLILKITNLRVRLNLTDSLLFKYEFY